MAAVFVWATTPAAWAGELTAQVTPVLPSVSLSVGGSQPAASYTITLTNTSTSGSMNVARLVGTSTVVGGSADAKAVFRSSTPYACTKLNAGTSIDCNVGSLALGASKTFTVTFTAPTSGTSIDFAWQAVFDNGTPPGNSNGNIGSTPIGLNPIDVSQVTSDVPANLQVTFFTGTGMATAADPWVTRVKAPVPSAASTALVVESVGEVDCAQASDLLTCNTTALTIPGSTFGTAGASDRSQFLEITLLRDASTISRGAKISSAVVYYKKDASADPPEPVPDCNDPAYPGRPSAGKPCEDRSQRVAYPRKNTGKTPVAPGYESDWKFVIYAFDNGKYNQ
jgi:hypothetical protein